MHIFFSGIGGGGIGPLALIAAQAGYEVSGSDKQESAYTAQLQKQGVKLHIGQTQEAIAAVHRSTPIDWLVYSTSIVREDANHPELVFAKTHNIRATKRDELLTRIITDCRLKLVAIAGTHGKSTTTAMTVWLLKELGTNPSYSIGAKVPFGPMGQFTGVGGYFVYECDEFDRNFLAFHPHLSLITGLGWDHHEVFPTQQSYYQAFLDFIKQSRITILWEETQKQLKLQPSDTLTVLNTNEQSIADISLYGRENRQDAWLAVQAAHQLTGSEVTQLVGIINQFPGLTQRMEELAPNLYTNYAHTPEKIRAGMNTALEIAQANRKELVVIYEPLTNRRQHHIKHTYKDSFAGAKKVHWVRTYLAREDPKLPVLTPAELIRHLDDPHLAEPAKIDETLVKTIRHHLENDHMVVAMDASGAGSLDEWLRTQVSEGKL